MLNNQNNIISVINKATTNVEETLKTYSHLFTSTLEEVVAVIDDLDYKTDDN